MINNVLYIKHCEIMEDIIKKCKQLLRWISNLSCEKYNINRSEIDISINCCHDKLIKKNFRSSDNPNVKEIVNCLTNFCYNEGIIEKFKNVIANIYNEILQNDVNDRNINGEYKDVIDLLCFYIL